MPRMQRTHAERLLANCPPGSAFHCRNGATYWNLRDLGSGLASMDEGTFRHHVTDQKNDFALWVRDVLGDHVLARDLWDTANPATTSRRVSERIAFLETHRT